MTYRATTNHAGLGVRRGDTRDDLDPESVEVRSGLFAPVEEPEEPAPKKAAPKRRKKS
jgi:hypothetical protein